MNFILNSIFSTCQCRGLYNSSYSYLTGKEAWLTRFVDVLHELFTGPSDLLICFGTFHRIMNLKRIRKPQIVKHTKTLKLVVFLSYFISLIIYLPSFWHYKDEPFPCIHYLNASKPENNSSICHFYQPRSDTALWDVYISMQLVIMKVVPTISIVMMNLIIIYKLRQLTNTSSLKVSEESASVSKPSDQEARLQSQELKTISSEIEQLKQNQQKTKFMIRLSKILKEARRTRMLITILTSYIILTVPHTVILSFWLFGADLSLWQEDGLTFRLLTGTSSLLLTCNYSLNFYLYCIANSDIRKAAVKVFQKFPPKPK